MAITALKRPKAIIQYVCLTRGQAKVTREDIHYFIEGLDIDSSVKEELLQITPQNYVGG